MEIVDIAEAPILNKLLSVLRKRGATAERARVCTRLAQLDAGARKSLLEEAAEMYASAGDLERAGTAATELMTLYPNDLEAVTCASTIAMATGHARQAAGWLRGALAVIEDDRSTRAARRAAGTPAYSGARALAKVAPGPSITSL